MRAAALALCAFAPLSVACVTQGGNDWMRSPSGLETGKKARDATYVPDTDDGGMDDTFKCVMEKTIQSGNPKRDAAKPVSKMCARVCQKDVDCAAWNPTLPDCLQVSNLYVSVPAGVCGKKQP